MKQPEDNKTLDMFPNAPVVVTEQLLADRLAAVKAQVARENSPANNELLINLYVGSSLELYLGYFEKFNKAIEAWGVTTALAVPELPAYYTVCPTCGKDCGTLTVLKRHKLLATSCTQCEKVFREHEPLVGTYAIYEIAKHMQQKPEAVEHFVCSALMARRAAMLSRPVAANPNLGEPYGGS